MTKEYSRRKFLLDSLKASAGIPFLPLFSSCAKPREKISFNKKIIILGIDGMDPFLLKQFTEEGTMPNFRRVMTVGTLMEMHSSIPPQSPVAWSDFAVGASARVHGIFDFIHRDPKTMTPYFSTSRVSSADKTVHLGNWAIPLGSGSVTCLREGKPFWEYLGEAGIPTTIFRMPGDFPVVSQKARCVSGMGTPDLMGSYGTFSFFTSARSENLKNISGGIVVPVTIIDNKIQTELTGPVNTLRTDGESVKIPLVVWRDPQNDIVKLQLQGQEFLMTTGEWSDWIPLSFDFVPHLRSVKGICKLYIKKIHPDFEMYVSPINIDPVDQALPITTPAEYGKELVRNVGYFHTKGLPADTNALSFDVLPDEEYMVQSAQILAESKRLFDYELGKLRSQACGVLFFYFSNLDQDSHMYWRAIDKDHPLYTNDLDQRYRSVIRNLYCEMDGILGKVIDNFDIGDDRFCLIVMSDHGFAPFYRCVNLNTWLQRNGYIGLHNDHGNDDSTFFENVDWSRTKAYGLGINALYINKENRERYGIVREQDVPRLIAQLKDELLHMKDPVTGKNAVSNVWIGREIYNRDDDTTPDMIVGWNRGFRASWETVLGGFSKDIFTDNMDKWSGDHCIDPDLVPAVLLTNRKASLQKPSLPDVTATVLAECNIPIPEHMTGKPLYRI